MIPGIGTLGLPGYAKDERGDAICKRCEIPLTNPNRWPEDEGWCSAICRELDRAEGKKVPA